MKEKITLRNYQHRLIEEVRQVVRDYGFKRIAICAGQGSGKSVIISYMASNAAKNGLKVLILSHRREIMRQNFEAIERFGGDVEMVDASTKKLKGNAIQCAMVTTVAARLKNVNWRNWLQGIDMILCDELHRANHDPVLDLANKDAYVFGFSASIIRYGNSKQLGNYYDCIVKSISTLEMVKLGFLTPSKHFSFIAPKLDDLPISSSTGDYVGASLTERFSKPERYKGVVDEYLRLTPDTKALVFTTSGDHCRELCEEFCKKGVSAKYLLSSETATKDRDIILQEFERGDFKVLVNISILDTGFSCNTIETIILDFATRSFTRYGQAVGRGSRLHRGKKFFTVLDFGNAIETFGKFEAEPPCGLWHLTGGGGIMATKCCPKDKGGCERLIPISAKICPYCQYTYPTQNDIYNVQLEEVIDDEMGLYSDLSKWAASRAKLGWSSNRILVTACIKNKDNQKKAFTECCKVLRTKSGALISDKFWFFFKKEILNKAKGGV